MKEIFSVLLLSKEALSECLYSLSSFRGIVRMARVLNTYKFTKACVIPQCRVLVKWQMNCIEGYVCMNQGGESLSVNGRLPGRVFPRIGRDGQKASLLRHFLRALLFPCRASTAKAIFFISLPLLST